MKIIDIYTDGSYSAIKNVGKWAFVAVENNEIIFKNSGLITDKNFLTGYQISCECQAVLEGLTWAKNNNYKAKIHVDYLGLICWVNDIWNEKPWKTNKEYTILYREKVRELRENLDSMVKVKSHSGNFYNELTDRLAKIN